MMPTFPPSSLRCRTAGFPRYGSKAGLSDGAFPALSPVKPAPGTTPCQLRFASILRVSRGGLRTPFRVGASFSVKHHHSTDICRFTPGALAPVRVMLSRSIITYWPHPPYSQAHRNFVALRLICDAFAVRERLVLLCYKIDSTLLKDERDLSCIMLICVHERQLFCARRPTKTLRGLFR